MVDLRDLPQSIEQQCTGLALIKDSEDLDTLSKLSRYEVRPDEPCREDPKHDPGDSKLESISQKMK
jgi:hypothetical protein